MRALRLMTAACLALAVGGCRPSGGSTAASTTRVARLTVHVFVPCGLAGPYGDLETAFDRRGTGIELRRKVGNYVSLCDDVKRGARPDVLLNLGEAELEPLLKQGIVKPADVVRIAVMPVALAAPAKNPLGLKSLQDLTRPEVKSIAIGDPSRLSLGRATKQALERLGLWRKLERKFILAPSAAFTGAEVAAGKVDAALGYKSCIDEVHRPGDQPAERKLTYVCDLPADLYDPIYATASVLAGTPNAAAARQFVSFCTEPVNDPVFTKWMYRPLGATHAGRR